MMTLDASCIKMVKILTTQITVGLFVPQDVIENDQHAMGHGDHRFLFAASTGDAMVLGRQVVAFRMRDHPQHFRQDRFEIGVALPALCLLPGHTPAQDARCLADGKRLISVPISANSAAAEVS